MACRIAATGTGGGPAARAGGGRRERPGASGRSEGGAGVVSGDRRPRGKAARLAAARRALADTERRVGASPTEPPSPATAALEPPSPATAALEPELAGGGVLASVPFAKVFRDEPMGPVGLGAWASVLVRRVGGPVAAGERRPGRRALAELGGVSVEVLARCDLRAAEARAAFTAPGRKERTAEGWRGEGLRHWEAEQPAGPFEQIEAERLRLCAEAAEEGQMAAKSGMVLGALVEFELRANGYRETRLNVAELARRVRCHWHTAAKWLRVEAGRGWLELPESQRGLVAVGPERPRWAGPRSLRAERASAEKARSVACDGGSAGCLGRRSPEMAACSVCRKAAEAAGVSADPMAPEGERWAPHPSGGWIDTDTGERLSGPAAGLGDPERAWETGPAGGSWEWATDETGSYFKRATGRPPP